MIAAMLVAVPALTSVWFMTDVKQQPAYEVTADNHIMLKSDRGGDVQSYAAFFTALERAGLPVHVMGQCSSACTMVLHNPKACATPNALFGFHAARSYNKTTLEVMGYSDVGNGTMWSYYPERVKARLGGRLGDDMVYIRGTDLLPPC